MCTGELCALQTRFSRNGVLEIGVQHNVISAHTISIGLCVLHSQLKNLCSEHVFVPIFRPKKHIFVWTRRHNLSLWFFPIILRRRLDLAIYNNKKKIKLQDLTEDLQAAHRKWSYEEHWVLSPRAAVTRSGRWRKTKCPKAIHMVNKWIYSNM